MIERAKECSSSYWAIASLIVLILLPRRLVVVPWDYFKQDKYRETQERLDTVCADRSHDGENHETYMAQPHAHIGLMIAGGQ